VRVWKNKIKSSSRGLARRTPVGGVSVTSRDLDPDPEQGLSPKVTGI